MAYVRGLLKRTGLSTSSTVIHRLNAVGTGVGIFFAVCMVGVISVQWTINHSVHNSFATLLFLSGTVHMCVQTAIDVLIYKTRKSRKTLMMFRLACSIVGVLLYGPLIVFSRIHSPLPQILGAVVEITISLMFFAFYCSYHAEWHSLALLIDIQWEEFLPLINQTRE